MRRFILGWKALGHEARFQARIVNYADDFVICCRRSAEQAAAAMRRAVEHTFADGNLTPDLGGRLTTAELTAAIVARVAP